MTFLQIQDDALERLNLPTVSSSDARTRIKRYINEGYRWLLGDVGMSRARDTTTTLNTVIGTAEYTVTASRIRFIRDTTSDLRLDEVTLGQLRAMDPGDTETGNPTLYALRQLGASTVKVRLWPTPSDVRTLDLDIVASVTDLNADGDVPVFAAEFHPCLSTYARLCEYEKMDDTRYKEAAQLWQAQIRALRFSLRKSDTREIAQGVTPRGYHSRLGSTYPDRQ